MTFDARNSFCSRLTSAICLYAQVQFHAKYPLIGSQSDREFTFSYAILEGVGKGEEGGWGGVGKQESVFCDAQTSLHISSFATMH